MTDIINEPRDDDVMRLRAHAVGIARDIADAFGKERNDGNSSAALFRHLADQLLAEPELVKAIGTWHAAALHQVDGLKPVMRKGVKWRPFCVAFNTPDGLFEVDLYAVDWEHAEARLAALKANGRVAFELVYREPDNAPAQSDAEQPVRAARHTWDDASATERTHARRLLGRHCSLELRATLSAHQEEWWRLNRQREASEADILQVLAAGLRASRVEADRKPAAGMVLSQSGKRSSILGPIVIDATAQWAGATHDAEGGWDFSSENWQKFVDALSAEPPLELMTSPGVSAPESMLHERCVEHGCQRGRQCPIGKCAMGARR